MTLILTSSAATVASQGRLAFGKAKAVDVDATKAVGVDEAESGRLKQKRKAVET